MPQKETQRLRTATQAGVGEFKNMQVRTEDRFVQLAAICIVLAGIIEIAMRHIW